MGFLNTILSIVFPVNCASCGIAGEDLCITCLSSSPVAERECPEWIFPLYDYRNKNIKNGIWLLKYKNKKRLANSFGELLYEKIIEELGDLTLLENFKNPLLIPIPLSQKRKKERGYNQAELICKKLISLDLEKNLKLETNVLIKTKDTAHQAQIENRTKRLKNIIGSFCVTNKERIQRKNIILIDDVITTGATLTEAKKVLLKAGAKKIFAFTVAH